MGTRGSFPGGKSGRGMKLTTHLHLVSRSKECVEIYLHSLNTSSWRGAQLKHRENFTFYVKTYFHNSTNFLLKLVSGVDEPVKTFASSLRLEDRTICLHRAIHNNAGKYPRLERNSNQRRPVFVHSIASSSLLYRSKTLVIALGKNRLLLLRVCGTLALHCPLSSPELLKVSCSFRRWVSVCLEL
jgi:hypothetical protein